MFKNGLSADGKNFHATYFAGYGEGLSSKEITSPDHRLAVVLDTETTGIDRQNDDIIEIAIRQFCFDRKTGAIVWLGSHYAALQEASSPLSEEVKKVTGLTDEKIAGQKIDWQAVEQLVAPAALVIAHNAAFDRQFVDRYIKATQDKIWACSFTQIDWSAYPVAKQPILALLHGFFYDGHRALNDIDALMHLLSMDSTAFPNSPYLLELLQNAKKPMAYIKAENAPFDQKDELKNKQYRWLNKVWTKKLPAADIPAEIEFLNEKVYLNQKNTAKVVEISLRDNFKND